MTDQQIEIGNKLLTFFIEHDGQLTESVYLPFLNKEIANITQNLINTTIIIMIEDYGLIRRNITNLGLKIITAEGLRACKIGLQKYIEEFEYKKELELKNLEANITTAESAKRKSKQSLIVSIIALAMALIAPTLAEIVNFNINKSKDNRLNTDCKCETNYKYQNIKDSTAKQNIYVTDSIDILQKTPHNLKNK